MVGMVHKELEDMEEGDDTEGKVEAAMGTANPDDEPTPSSSGGAHSVQPPLPKMEANSDNSDDSGDEAMDTAVTVTKNIKHANLGD